jgi:dihydroorotate dehydrogenase
LIIGGNIGKNKDTPNEQATKDYAYCFETLFPYVDYFVVNVSSPNTPNLRDLQEKEPLTKLLQQLQDLNQQHKTPKPILLKIAPDLTDGQLDDILDIVETTKIEGIVATNTTLDRSKIDADSHQHIGAGGLSGAPLRARATAVVRYLRTHARNPNMVIIGVGGIEKPEHALEKLEAGADLVQIYSGFIYEGPMMVRRICEKLI